MRAESVGPAVPVPSRVAVVAYPGMHGSEEFAPLLACTQIELVWARAAAQLQGADMVILPGCLDSAANLRWMRMQGLDAAVAAHAQQGGRVLGVGGGLPMLGEALIDLHSVQGNAPGLGLLPLVTVLQPQPVWKLPRQQLQLPALRGAWSAVRGLCLQVQPVQIGQTHWRADMQAGLLQQATEVVPGMAWQSALGHVWGCYWHGMWASAALRHAIWGQEL